MCRYLPRDRHDESARAMAEMVEGWPNIVEARVQIRDSLLRIFGGKIGTETGFSPSTVASLCQ